MKKKIMLLSLLLAMHITYGAEQPIITATQSNIDRKTAQCWILSYKKRGAFDKESKTVLMHWRNEPEESSESVLAVERDGIVKVTIVDAQNNVVKSLKIRGTFAFNNPMIELFGAIRLYTKIQNGDVHQTIFKREYQDAL